MHNMQEREREREREREKQVLFLTIPLKQKSVLMLFDTVCYGKNRPYAKTIAVYRSYAGEFCAIVIRNSYVHLCAPVARLMRAA